MKCFCLTRYSSRYRSSAGWFCEPSHKGESWIDLRFSKSLAGFVRHHSHADSRRLSQTRLNHHQSGLLWHRRLTSLQGCHHNLHIFCWSDTQSSLNIQKDTGKLSRTAALTYFLLPGCCQSLITVAENLPLEVFNLLQKLPVITS